MTTHRRLPVIAVLLFFVLTLAVGALATWSQPALADIDRITKGMTKFQVNTLLASSPCGLSFNGNVVCGYQVVDGYVSVGFDQNDRVIWAHPYPVSRWRMIWMRICDCFDL